VRWAVLSFACLLVCSARAFAAFPLPDACSLLTRAEVTAAIGGSPQSRSAVGSSRLEHTCTWTGAPQGYMESRTQLTVSILRVSKTRFVDSTKQGGGNIVSGLDTVAYADQAGLSVWKNGLLLELDGSYLSVYPSKALALARSVLRRL
jgi:hypothetical protein